MAQGGLTRAWDEFDAYLFDIDGTLIECTDAVHYFGFCDALSRVAGRPVNLDGVQAHGNTDVGILRDAFRVAGVAEDVWRPRREEIVTGLCGFVEARTDEFRVRTLPEVRRVLEHLRGRGAKLGVATGNLERIGRAKLQRAGLLEFFEFAGWSDAFERRADVFAHAVEEARKVTHDGAAMLVVGDTPADVRAAKENGLPVVAVATGIFPAEELLREGPELCVATLSELMADVR